MYCSKCGEEINDQAIICPKCGCATVNYCLNVEKKANIEADCISIYKKDKNNNLITQIVGFLAFALLFIALILFLLELMPLLHLRNIKNLSSEQQLKALDEVVKGMGNLGNYKNIAIITALLSSLIPFVFNHHQNKTTFEWLKNYNLEKSLEKALTTSVNLISKEELKKEKVIISSLLNAKVYDKKLQFLSLLNQCLTSIFFVFLWILGFSTLQVAYQKAVVTTNINWWDCMPAPLLGICIFFLILALIFDTSYRIILKNKKKVWVKQSVKSGYMEYLKYFK